MKAFDVHVADKPLKAFRRKAVAEFHKKREYIEFMFIRRGVGQFHIERLVKLKILEATEHIVRYDDKHLDELVKQARSEGLEYGTIHSHVNCDSSPSKDDHTDGVSDGECLVGVLEISRNKGRVRSTLDFWIPQLPCRINLIAD